MRDVDAHLAVEEFINDAVARSRATREMSGTRA
jgi:hypothetical protein